MTDLTSQNPNNSAAVPDSRWRAEMKASRALRHHLMHRAGWEAERAYADYDAVNPLHVTARLMMPGPRTARFPRPGDKVTVDDRFETFAAVGFEMDPRPGVEIHIKARADHVDIIEENGWLRIRVRGHEPLERDDDARASVLVTTPHLDRAWLHEAMKLAESRARDLRNAPHPDVWP